MELEWEPGFAIRVRTENGAAVISANREGLLSLANHLTALAMEPPGSHLHLDVHNSLEDGSAELILERTAGGDETAPMRQNGDEASAL